jgi:L-iditol 2-dehydrogenase
MGNIEFGTGTFAEYILKPDWLLVPIPSDITYDEASMACCGLGPALGAGNAMNIRRDDKVLITGLGPVGLGAVIDSTYRGARVIGISRNEYRRSLAMNLGAEITFDPTDPDINEKILQRTNGKGVDKVIECTGEAIHQQLAFISVKQKGQIAFIGESSGFTFNISKYLLRKGLTLHGIWHWNLNDSQQMIDTIRGSKEKISQLITHIFPLEKIEEAIKLQLTANCGKVILRP